MTTFVAGGAPNTPFGDNEFLRSTKGIKRDHYMFASATLPAQTIDGVSGLKLLPRGLVLAKITSGPDSGKVGPFQAAGTSEVQTVTITGAPTGGTYTLTFSGQTTAAIPFNATAAQVQTALEALSNIDPGDVLAAGGPHPATAVTVTFFGDLAGDPPQMTAAGSFTGGTTPAVAVTTTTAGVAGAADGRQLPANIVGINDTFLPWQLAERDVEVAAVYEASAVQAWCYEMTAAGLLVAVTNGTATNMQRGGLAGKGVDITWK